MSVSKNLYLMFLVGDMFADYRIILLDLQFARGIGFIFCGCVKMTGLCG